MTILVIAEHNNAELNAATVNTVAAAQAIGGDIEVLVAGAGCAPVAAAAARIAVEPKLLFPTNPPYANHMPKNTSRLTAELARTTRTSWPPPAPAARTTCRALQRCWTWIRSPRSLR